MLKGQRKQMDTWHSISLEKERAHLESAIHARFVKIAVSFSGTKGLDLYAKKYKMNESHFPHIIYIPPRSVPYCRDLIKDYDAKPCDPPVNSEIGRVGGAGIVDPFS